MKTKQFWCLLLVLLLLTSLLTACQSGPISSSLPDSSESEPVSSMPVVSSLPDSSDSLPEEPPLPNVPSVREQLVGVDLDASVLEPYAYLFAEYEKYHLSFAEGEYNPNAIMTYCFDETTVFAGSEELAAMVHEGGKNPGLGVRGLHAQGITGQGVKVAIIDQNMILTHPEIEGKVAAYHDVGTKQGKDQGSYHGISVASLLVGETVGTAPGAELYYAAVPSWKMDAQDDADALYWIIAQNEQLPEGEKIRLVSVSAAPQSENDWYKNGDAWIEAVQAARDADIFVMDCRSGYDTNFVFAGYYNPLAPEDVRLAKGVYPPFSWGGGQTEEDVDVAPFANVLCAPASFRTMGQQYTADEAHYRYDGVGGQSWAVPYVAGVMAMGWQLRPDLDGDALQALLFDTAYVNENGFQIINPPAFIEAVRNA